VDWYGPNTTWPRHGRPYFREALNYARDAEWWFGKFQSHGFGKAVCDKDLPPGARCEFPIFSTGSGSESAALELRLLVDRCPHKVPSDSRASATDVAEALLDEADLLIQAAERCINADNLQAAAEELLDLATTAADGATALLSPEEDNLERALGLESASREERDAAQGLADAAGYPDEEPVEPEPLLGAADGRVATAERRLGPASNTGRRRSRVRARATETGERIRAIRDQLGT
jgi:hypothetical protein